MKKKYYLLFFLSVIAFNVLFGASADHLIFSRVSTIPNEAEAISIYNPTSDAIPLNNLHDIDNPNRGAYFLTDGYVSDDSHKHYTNIPFINNGYKIINELYEADFSYCGSLGEFVFSDKPDSLYNIIINENHNDEVILSYFNKINLDCDGVVDECGLCNGPGIPNEECDCFGNVFDCSGVCGGTDDDLDNDGICESIDTCVGLYDVCGICEGDDTSCIDCNQVENGYAYLDDCGICVGGETEPCFDDCKGVSGGDAFIDHCGNCIDIDEEEEPCRKDCFGVWGGDGVLDTTCCDCGEPTDSNYIDCTPDVDCYDDCMDACSICGRSATAFGYDCFGNCILNVDACGVCGGNITDSYECNYGMDENCPIPPNTIYLDHNNEIWINTGESDFKNLNFNIAGSILINSTSSINDEECGECASDGIAGSVCDCFVLEKEFWSGNYTDFFIQFPENSTIMPGETQIISMHMDSIFYDYYYYYPDYNIHELTTNPTEVFPGGNTFDYLEDSGNNGESLILFYWDGESNVVKDVDYFLWGGRSLAIDKTNIPNYNADQPADFQSVLDNIINHFSYNRKKDSNNFCCEEFGETDNGGNGKTGHNETSENFEESWFVEFNSEKTLGCMDDSECNYDIGKVIDEFFCLEITDFCNFCDNEEELDPEEIDFCAHHCNKESPNYGTCSIDVECEEPEEYPWNPNTNYCTIDENACLGIETAIWNMYTKPLWNEIDGYYDYTMPLWNSNTNNCEIQRYCAINYDSSADVNFSEIFDIYDYTANDRCIYNYGCTNPSFLNFDIEATQSYGSCINPEDVEYGLVSIKDINNGIYSEYDEVLVTGKIVDFRAPYDGFWVITIRDEDNYRVSVVPPNGGWNIETSKLNYLVNAYNYTEFIVSVKGEIDFYDEAAQIVIGEENLIDDYIRYHRHGEFHEDFNSEIMTAKIIPAPYVIIPSQGERLDYLYSFPSNSRVIIRVISLDGRVITSLLDNFYTDGGTVERKEELSDWDGRDHLGQIVPPGTYLFHIEASNFTTGKTYEHVAPVVVGINHK